MKSRLRLITNLWEGVVAAEFTLAQVRQRCARLAQALLEQNLSCLIAYDTRFMSSLFAEDIYQYLSQQGVSVSLVPSPAPLPAVQLALDNQQADCALVVSARNRAYWYNGLVLLQRGASSLSLEPDPTQIEQSASNPGARLDELPFPSDEMRGATGQMYIGHNTLDVRQPYLDRLSQLVDVNLIRRSTLTIFADPMHGTVAGYLPAIIGDGSQTKAIEINRETDPLFSKATPLPAETGLARLRKLVRESDSHVGLAFSADGTVLGVVDKNGEQIDRFEIVLLLASYLFDQYRQKGVVIAPPPAAGTPLANVVAGFNSWEKILGFKVELPNNPTHRIVDFLAQDERANLLVGCTSDGELILSGYSPYPDALIAGMLIVELIARSGGSLRTSLDDLRASLGT